MLMLIIKGSVDDAKKVFDLRNISVYEMSQREYPKGYYVTTSFIADRYKSTVALWYHGAQGLHPLPVGTLLYYCKV